MNSISPPRARILLVDDEPDLLHVIALRLSVAGYDVETAASGSEALAKIPVYQPQLVISDLRMEGMDGLELFEAIVRQWPILPVIILTAHGTIPDAVEATRRGVFGYLTKPFNHKEMQAQIKLALEMGGGFPQKEQAGAYWRESIISRSSIMESLLAKAERAARSEANILLKGASGTGKQMLAHAIHRASKHAGHEFIAVDCSTHSIKEFISIWSEQNHAIGTLFLRNIDRLSPEDQRRLTDRLLAQDLGSVDKGVRVMSATSKNLEDDVKKGKFREDLFFLLGIVVLDVPSLTERREDIPLLARYFLDQISIKHSKELKGFSPQAMERLIAYDWPGNLHQLRLVMERLVVMSSTPLIPAAEVASVLDNDNTEIPSLVETRAQAEREYLIRILTLTEGNVAAAARMAKRNRTEFYKLLNRHHINAALFKTKS